MKFCNNLTLSLLIASLSVVFYIIGAIIFTLFVIEQHIKPNDNIFVPIIFLVICLIMSIVSGLLIFGIVKVNYKKLNKIYTKNNQIL